MRIPTLILLAALINLVLAEEEFGKVHKAHGKICNGVFCYDWEIALTVVGSVCGAILLVGVIVCIVFGCCRVRRGKNFFPCC